MRDEERLQIDSLQYERLQGDHSHRDLLHERRRSIEQAYLDVDERVRLDLDEDGCPHEEAGLNPYDGGRRNEGARLDVNERGRLHEKAVLNPYGRSPHDETVRLDGKARLDGPGPAEHDRLQQTTMDDESSPEARS